MDGATVLPVTHKDMSRFFFSINHAVEFSVWALAQMRGGELFVPKMPSFLITNLAEAFGLSHQITGIRGAEKLSEVMVTDDEARYFREWNSRYVRFPEGVSFGKPLPDGFEYRSDNNSQWLSVDQLKSLINGR